MNRIDRTSDEYVDMEAIGGKAFYSTPEPRFGRVYKLALQRSHAGAWGAHSILLWAFGPKNGGNVAICLQENDIPRLIDYLITVQRELGISEAGGSGGLAEPPFPNSPTR